ncbi:major facilitator superfamily MFS_1 [Thermoproteus uzoniensis 768-20]|uniref:Major facilitator superfamily MFS_1 n=1 Tax=Thermoproteus uzoniensis (strain 768-20) TaxID=999630 RepID=F2L5H7_THEU7|nr:MFS transporter [Thermoproteus uzoniensis]AEA12348.1 major facilitator superfamily MFS_1 [Thermoproteus uzoniensis 768-20]
MGPRKAALVALASASFFMSYFSRLAWSIASAYSDLRPTVYQNGVVFALFFAGYVAVQIPAGVLSDKIGPARVASAALLGLAGASALSGLAPDMEVEYAASLAMGLAAGWIYPATVKLLSSEFRGGELPVAMGYYSLAWPLSVVLSGLALPAVSISLGWRWDYYIIAAASAALALAYVPLRVSAVVGAGQARRPSLGNGVAVVSAAGFLFFAAYWTVTLYAYKYFLDIGLNDYYAGLAYSMTALLGIPATVAAGYVIRRLGVKRTLVAFEGIYGALVAALAAGPATVFPVAAAMGFVRFVITPANSTAVSKIGGESAGSAAGTANLFWQLSGAVAPPIASAIVATIGFKALWIFAGALSAASAAIYQALLDVE